MSGFPKKYKAQLTPKGTFKFPKLNTPDTYKGDTKFKVGLLADPDDAEVQAWIEKLTRIRDEEVERTKKELIDAGKPGLAKKVTVRDVFHMDTDKEGEETGLIVFHASMKAEVKDKKTGELKQLRPKFFDAAGKPIKKVPEIWGGTVGRLGVDVMGSKRPADGAIGVTLYLDAVFLIDLKTGGGRDASSYGYTGEEGGYSADDDDGDSGYDYGGEDAAAAASEDGDNTDF